MGHDNGNISLRYLFKTKKSSEQWPIHILTMASTRTHMTRLLPQPNMDIHTRSWMGPAVIWDERCPLSRGGIGLREPSL
jgi:hypothetical protein